MKRLVNSNPAILVSFMVKRKYNFAHQITYLMRESTFDALKGLAFSIEWQLHPTI